MLGLSLLALLAAISPTAAANIQWIAGSGNWTAGTNWSGGVAPGVNDHAQIITTGANVSLGRSRSVNTLTLSGGGTLNMTAVEVGAALGAVTINIGTNGTLHMATTDSRANVGQLLSITGGSLSGLGTIVVGSGGQVTQSGGAVSVASLTAPTYVMSNGTIAAGATINAATFTQSGSAGMSGKVVGADYTLGGDSFVDATSIIDFSNSFTLKESGNVRAGAQLRGGAGSTMTQASGLMAGTVTGVTSYTHGNGEMRGAVTTGSYLMNGAGFITGTVNFADSFTLSGTGGTNHVRVAGQLKGGAGSTFNHTSGNMAGTVGGVTNYVHTGGEIRLAVSTVNYDLAGSAAGSRSTATITASGSFLLRPDGTGTVTVEGKLSGSGGIVKSGAATVSLANAANDFAGTVSVEAGTLEAINDALPASATATVADGATLRFATGADTTFLGTATGAGTLQKTGAATLVLGGEMSLGALLVDAGQLSIGTGTSANTIVFDRATIAVGATLYIAENATLTITLEHGIVNDGILINDGTVNDDLHNSNSFSNNGVYNANVASNTGSIENTMPGVWTGDVLSNFSNIWNLGGATWNGKVSANFGSVYNRTASSWNGNLTSNFGYIQNLESSVWTGDIVANNRYVNNYLGATWNGDILSNRGEIKNDATWNGDVLGNRRDIFNYERWNGDVAGNNGTVWNLDGGIWTGDVTGNDGFIESAGTGVVWNGDVIGNAAYLNAYLNSAWNGHVYANTGKIGMDATWTGDVFGNAGTIDATEAWVGRVVANTGTIWNHDGGTWTGNVETNAGTIWNEDGNWSGNVLTNLGTITTEQLWTGNFASAGTVNAKGQIVGAFANSGTLKVTGALTGITTLSNLGNLTMQGNGATQLATVATASFGPGSIFDVDVHASGASDKLVVTGNASLDGIVRVHASGNGTFDDTKRYTILEAGDIGSTTFDSVTTDLSFLAPQLTHDTTDELVYVTLRRNDVGFEEIGSTANQKAVAAAAEALGSGNALYDALLWLTGEQAEQALDLLTGEMHASLGNTSVEGALILSNILAGRINQAFGGLGGQGVVNSYAPTDFVAEPVEDSTLWLQFYGARGSVAPNGSASGTDAAAAGMAAGLDGALGDWRLGLMLHGGLAKSAAAGLGSTVDSYDYGGAIYGGTEVAGTTLVMGAGYTGHAIGSTRNVVFAGFSNTLTATYGAGTIEAFGQASHEFDFGAMSLTPFAGLAHVRHMTDGFAETGGPAAISAAASVLSGTFTTLGLEVEHEFLVNETMLITMSGALGWRHAFTDAPATAHTLAGGTNFAVVGSAGATDSLSVAAGIYLDAPSGQTLDLAYDGQLAPGAMTHGFKGTWTNSF